MFIKKARCGAPKILGDFLVTIRVAVSSKGVLKMFIFTISDST